MNELNQLIKTFELLEQYLGSPHDNNALIHNSQILEFDEQEQLNNNHLDAIKKWGYFEYFIPEDLGGKFKSLQSSFILTRAISRRDLTLSVALGINFLASLPIWLSRCEAMKKMHAANLHERKISAIALTEKAHGSDLSAIEVVAESVDSGWLLNGEKWCINYATLGDTITILCRTHKKNGPLSFSLFYIDKQKINGGMIPLAKLPTHGVRGLDISGVQLNDLHLPLQAIIGSKGQGLFLTYKTLQVSRLLCSSFTLGGSDTALRMALDFSLNRKLYQKMVFDLPVVRQRLAECFCLQIMQDCVALSVVRAASVAPGNLTIWSAMVKFFTPLLAEKIIEQCGLILGARGYLRTEAFGLFQKIKRDTQVVGLFDGSSEVNLYLISSNLISQVQLRENSPESLTDKAQTIFDFEKDIPPFNGESLHLFAQQADCILMNLNQLVCPVMTPQIDKILNCLARFDRQLLDLNHEGAFEANSLEAYRFAETYCWLFAASCILQVWFYNQDKLPQPLQNIAWLGMSIDLIIKKIDGCFVAADKEQEQGVIKSMLWFYEHNQMFSPLNLSIVN